MRRLNQQPQMVAQESISSKMLMEYGMSNADFLPIIMSAHKDVAPLTALLVARGKTTKGVNYTSNFFDANGNATGNYRTVGSNCVEYRIEKADIPICHFKANAAGETYIDDMNPSTSIGKGKLGIWVFLDSNVAGYKDIIQLADGDTQLHIQNDPEPSSNGTWKAFVKLLSGEKNDSINPALLADGMEFQLHSTLHEQDFSERGNQRYNFGSVERAYLSLQRIAYSYSGTAFAMKSNNKISGYMMEHAGTQSFISEADYQMTRYASQFNENALLEGKTTVSQDLNKCVLQDENGRDLLAGNGIMNSGDGPFKFPITSRGFTDAWFNSFLSDIDQYINPDSDGVREVAIVGGTRLRMSFNTFLANKNLSVKVQNIAWKNGDKQGIVDTYNYYEFAGIRIIFLDSTHFSNKAGITLNDGTRSNEWMGYVVPMGNTRSGQAGITIITLRPSVKGTVAGIDKGGNIASSVDGTHTHMLWQNGVICTNQVFQIYRPWSNSTIVSFN